MPLPKISTPQYELILPSTEKAIKYRPFLVKEEKILLLALESQDTKQITNAIKSVIKNCLLTKGIKVESLPTFDIEYLFLNIRAKSVGEQIELNITCPDDGETTVPLEINVEDIQIQIENILNIWDEMIQKFDTNESLSPTILCNEFYRKYSEEEFKLTLEYYSNHPEKLEKIYDKVLEELIKERTTLNP